MTYEEKSSPTAGRGLFCTKDLRPGTLVLQDKAPFGAVLDADLMTRACSWCFNFPEEAEVAGLIPVSACKGCQVVRYCGKACQTAAWKHSHKYECKIYKSLYPEVLPNTARMVLLILLRHKNNAIPEDEWESFLALRHHMDDLEKGVNDGNPHQQENMQNLQLIARAGKEYSGTSESLSSVESLVGRLFVNTMTLSSPLFTPLGLIVSLKGSLLNHSCEPNSAIVFNGRALELRTIEALQTGTELTVSYVKTTVNVNTRRSELQLRYHFFCNCSQCTRGCTFNVPDTTSYLDSFASENAWQEFDLQIRTIQVKTKSSTVKQAFKLLAEAYQLAQKYPKYPLWFSPLYQLRFEIIMALQVHGYHVGAFIHCMIVHFKINPVVFPEISHPARVARDWVNLKTASHCGALAMEPGFADASGAGDEGILARAISRRFSLDWGMVVYFFVKTVSDQVLKSHGVENKLSLEVGRAMRQMSEEARQTRGQPTKTDLDTVRSRLNHVANEGWAWWIQQMRERRDSQRLLASDVGEDVSDALNMLLQ